MLRGRQIETRLVFARETTYGQAPATGAKVKPFFAESLARSNPAQEDFEVGTPQFNRRDPVNLIDGDVDVTGSVTVPIDTATLKDWLDLVFGDPVTTGSAPNLVHTYTSGAAALPSAFLESRAGDFHKQTVGCMATGFSVALAPQWGQLAKLQIDFAGSNQVARAAAPQYASPAAAPLPANRRLARQRLGRFLVGGVELGRALGLNPRYQNGIEAQRYIGRADGFVSEMTPGDTSFTDTLTLRVINAAQLNALPTRSAPAAVQYGWEIDANNYLRITANRAYFEDFAHVVDGPGYIQVSPNLVAIQTDAAPMLTVTLGTSVGV